MAYQRRATVNWPTTPTTGISAEILPAYDDRTALVAVAKASRHARACSLSHHASYEAARDELLKIRPLLDHDEAGRRVAQYTAYAASRWSRWFNRPVRLQIRQRERMSDLLHRSTRQPAATMGELQAADPHWLWMSCLNPRCRHSSAVPLASIVIRFGPEVTWNELTRAARCELCGGRGANLSLPGWRYGDELWEPYPHTDQEAAMCGRYRLKRPWREIHDLYEITNDTNRVEPRWNIAPTQDVPVFRYGDHGLEVSMLRWGLVPGWAKDLKIGNQCINARGESVGEKPAFRSAFRQRRCLLVADGHYEWRPEGKIKQPYLLTIGDDEPYTFAGLWERWTAPTGEVVETACLLTTTPNQVAEQVHDRMPVILPREAHATWLDPKATAEMLKGLIKPYPPERMKFRKVTTKLNSARNEGPELDSE